MKISYTVVVDEEFEPPVHGLGPSNYDPTIHQARLITVVNETDAHPDWSRGCRYVLRKKKVVKSWFEARTDAGNRQILASIEQAWNYPWSNFKRTKFVVESIYEDNVLIDIIVHRDPPSKG